MRILILGGGISGLSAAWHLRKQNPSAQITLLEKENRLGGYIGTSHIGTNLIELGPRTFAEGRSPFLLNLISEMGLKEELLFSSPKTATRYLWHQGKLRASGKFIPMLLKGLLRELFIPRKCIEDESIHAFAVRRLGRKIADTLLDPMTLGIYAGDARQLSVRSCFPFLFSWEQKGKSLLRGLFSSPKGGRLFTLQRGLSSLIDALEQKVEVDIVRNSSVTAIYKNGVEAQGRLWEADRIISALPGQVIGRLTKCWPDFPTQSLHVAHLGFKEKIPSTEGFGYLVPTLEKETLLGMIWDSSIFPRKEASFQTICTAMLASKGDPLEVLSAVKRHLKWEGKPDWIETRFLHEALPKFVVGYRKKWLQVEEDLKSSFPTLTLVGNYIDGVSVESCVQRAVSLTL